MPSIFQVLYVIIYLQILKTVPSILCHDIIQVLCHLYCKTYGTNPFQVCLSSVLRPGCTAISRACTLWSRAACRQLFRQKFCCWESWHTYCWWKKSCTSWYGEYPIIYRVSYIPGGAGFLPSTVATKTHTESKKGDGNTQQLYPKTSWSSCRWSDDCM